jgi:hypothetical protein
MGFMDTDNTGPIRTNLRASRNRYAEWESAPSSKEALDAIATEINDAATAMNAFMTRHFMQYGWVRILQGVGTAWGLMQEAAFAMRPDHLEQLRASIRRIPPPLLDWTADAPFRIPAEPSVNEVQRQYVEREIGTVPTALAPAIQLASDMLREPASSEEGAAAVTFIRVALEILQQRGQR